MNNLLDAYKVDNYYKLLQSFIGEMNPDEFEYYNEHTDADVVDNLNAITDFYRKEWENHCQTKFLEEGDGE